MRRALLLDDSSTARLLVAGHLRALGFDVEEAGDGADGLDLMHASGTGFDVVLVDWHMPRLDGLEFVRAVRDVTGFASIKLLMVTTEIELHRVSDALAAGADEYLMKPFTRDMLANKLAMLGVWRPE